MDSRNLAPKTFSTVISLQTRRLKIPKGFYSDYHQCFPNQLWVETGPGLQYRASVDVDARGTPYLETDIDRIMEVLGTDGLDGVPQSREAQLTYLSSRGIFTIHYPISTERLLPRLMHRQPAPLQIVPPNNEDVQGFIEQNPVDGDNLDNSRVVITSFSKHFFVVGFVCFKHLYCCWISTFYAVNYFFMDF